MSNGRQYHVFRQVHALFSGGTIGDLTDGQLLERYTTQSGEVAERAFAALVERHGPMVIRTCQAILRNPHDVDDAFQATFLVLARRSDSLWVQDSLGGWIHQVAHRTSCCVLSAATRRRRHEQKAAELAARSVRDVSRDDLGQILHNEICRLPGHYRSAVVLCLLEGLTQEQAARCLGWPVGTVQSRLARGRERLRVRLTRRGLAPTAVPFGAVLCANVAWATVPAGLISSTVWAAMRFGTGQVSAGLVSASISALTKEVQEMMFLSRVKKFALALVGVGLIASGVGVFARPGDAESQGTRLAEVQVLQIPVPQAGSRMEILVEEPGKFSERLIPELDATGRLRVKVEQHDEKGQKTREIVCSSIQIVNFDRRVARPGAPAQQTPRASSLPTRIEPASAPAGVTTTANPDYERRLSDMERKLDLILKSLDGLKRDAPR